MASRITIEKYLEACNYLYENKATIRVAARKYKISKSALHGFISKTLYNYDFMLYRKVRKILLINLKERAIRGGMAAKPKYLK